MMSKYKIIIEDDVSIFPEMIEETLRKEFDLKKINVKWIDKVEFIFYCFLAFLIVLVIILFVITEMI